jgi:CHAT domain-containing protein
VAAALDTLTFGLGRLLSGFGTATGLAAAGAAATRAAAALDAALLDPLRAELADDDLVLCPTGALAAVPWALLPGCRGRTVRVAPSATVWCRAREGRPERRRDVLVVAGPRLPGAESEAADVAGLHDGSTRLAGDDATVSRVVDAAAHATLLHLAAHGRLRTDNPLFSTLELADGPLTGYDLETMGRTPDAVVLSACSSGAGHATVADETLGLAWTLMGLGTSTVVAPLLPVPDAGTRDLMVAVHTRVAAGAGLAEALALAQRDTDPDDLTAVGVASAFVAFGA